MKDICSVCSRAYDSQTESICSTCNQPVCPECLNIYQSRCQECYFESKDPRNNLK